MLTPPPVQSPTLRPAACGDSVFKPVPTLAHHKQYQYSGLIQTDSFVHLPATSSDTIAMLRANIIVFPTISRTCDVYSTLLSKLSEQLQSQSISPVKDTIGLELSVYHVITDNNQSIASLSLRAAKEITVLCEKSEYCLLLGYSSGGYPAAATHTMLSGMLSNADEIIQTKSFHTILLDTDPLQVFKTTLLENFSLIMSNILTETVDNQLHEPEKEQLKGILRLAIYAANANNQLLPNKVSALIKNLNRQCPDQPTISYITSVILPEIKKIVNHDQGMDIPDLLEEGSMAVIASAESKHWQQQTVPEKNVTIIPNSDHKSLVTDHIIEKQVARMLTNRLLEAIIDFTRATREKIIADSQKLLKELLKELPSIPPVISRSSTPDTAVYLQPR